MFYNLNIYDLEIKTKQTTKYTHILNSTERNEWCLKTEKELYTINIFRYMKLILDVEDKYHYLYKYMVIKCKQL